MIDTQDDCLRIAAAGNETVFIGFGPIIKIELSGDILASQTYDAFSFSAPILLV